MLKAKESTDAVVKPTGGSRMSWAFVLLPLLSSCVAWAAFFPRLRLHLPVCDLEIIKSAWKVDLSN